MSELRAVALAARALRARGEPFALATLVHVRGSSYRLPGARMIMTRDRWVAGCVSGGCLEGDVVRKAWWRTASGEPALVTYDSSSEDDVGWGFGLGCNGVATLLIERVTEAHDPLAYVERCVDGERRGALVTVYRSEHPGVPVGARLSLAADGSRATTIAEGPLRDRLAAAAASVLAGRPTYVDETDEVGALVEAVAPPPHLFVFGSGHDALPVVQMAKTVGWRVTVVERKGRFATRERFGVADRVTSAGLDALRETIDASDRALAIVMSHDYDGDRDALGALLGSRAVYIGVLGPRRRTERMLAELGGSTSAVRDAWVDPRLHAPVGLALGAETPQEIALSIMAEAQAAVTGSAAVSLRDRTSPIHARGAPAHVAALRGEANSARGRWSCAVLAAGGSRRLGRPKQLVLFQGRPLVRHVVEQACASGCPHVAVVVGAHGRAIAEALAGLPVTLLDNAEWEEGMASSIRLATIWARDVGSVALALTLADQPRLTATHLARLAEAHRGGAAKVGSAYAGIVGVPALFDARLFDRLLALKGDRGASALFADGEGAVAIPWPEGVIDVDTAADVVRLGELEPTRRSTAV